MSHHHHSHSHTHEHVYTPQTFDKAFAIATIFNLTFTVVEAVYALLAHSMSLLADAGHNLGDVLGIIMAWGAMLLLKRASTEKYSYGYKKTTMLSALANALLLVFASAIILYEAIYKLFYPASLNEIVVIVIALIGIGVNGGTALLFKRGSEKDLNVKSTFLHLVYDALISLGVVIAGSIIYFTHWVWLDPLVGIVIVLMILVGTWRLLRNSVDLILGAVPHDVDQQAVRRYLQNLVGVQTVHDLHIWGLSTQENALTAHLVVPERIFTDADFAEINHTLAHDYKINHVTIQIETGSKENPCGRAIKC